LLQIFPFLSWLAPVASGALLAVLWDLGELRLYTGAAALAWFLVAGNLQFFGITPVVCAVALMFQTNLAVALFVRWKLAN